MTSPKESSGIEELIGRLRQQGVERGKTQAEELVQATQLKAEQRLDDARREAEEMIQLAREEAKQTKLAGEEAVRLAVRDALLTLKAEMVERFADRVRRLVTRELEDHDFLQSLILEIGRRCAPTADQRVSLLLPKDVVGLEQLRSHPEELKEGTLSHFVATITKDMLVDGLEIGLREDKGAGIRIQLRADDIEIEVTDQAVSELLLRHLVPRFRAIMEGVIS